MSERAIAGEILPNDELVETEHSLAILRPPDASLPKAWDKQAWESIVSYRRFVEHYLSQAPPLADRGVPAV